MKSYSTNEIPEQLYTAADCRDIDQTVILSGGVSGYELMTHAGKFVFECIQQKFPAAKNWVIFCGNGNNGGDGYVVAGLAKCNGLDVVVYATKKPPTTDDAKTARDFALAQGCQIFDLEPDAGFSDELADADLIVDALLGTGVDRPVTGFLSELVNTINSSPAVVVCCDVPTGLNSDTGSVMGCCVKADVTATFIALKAGMFTADAKEYCGQIKFTNLGIESSAYRSKKPQAKLISISSLKATLLSRSENAHKGTTGYAAVVGGVPGMMGAVLMAGKAAYRTGAGRVKVVTHEQHASQLALNCPELLTQSTEDDLQLEQFQGLALGPGLGQTEWARSLYNQVMQVDLPLVIDADGLNLLALEKQKRENWVLTPHPGEAARLLACDSTEIQANRYEAARAIVDQYGGICVLKGSGTLIASEQRITRVCEAGNSGQATAGMGDVLTGCIIGLVVQGYGLFEAACLGTWLHATAADKLVAERGKIGLIATDLLDQIQVIHNQLYVD